MRATLGCVTQLLRSKSKRKLSNMKLRNAWDVSSGIILLLVDLDRLYFADDAASREECREPIPCAQLGRVADQVAVGKSFRQRVASVEDGQRAESVQRGGDRSQLLTRRFERLLQAASQSRIELVEPERQIANPIERPREAAPVGNRLQPQPRALRLLLE